MIVYCRYLLDIAWVKRTVNRKLAKCHGYYLQHAKETCLVGIKVSPTAQIKIILSFFALLGRAETGAFQQIGWQRRYLLRASRTKPETE